MQRYVQISQRIVQTSLFKNSSVYTLASFTNAVIPFLLLPFLTRYLMPFDYGIITMYVTVQAFLYPILSVNLEGAVMRRYYTGNTDLPVYIGNCLLIVASTTILLLLFVFLLSPIIESITAIPCKWILTIPLICVAQFLCNLILTLWQVREKPFNYAGFQILQSLINALLTLLFVIVLSYKWTGRISTLIITTLCFALIAAIILYKQKAIKFQFNKEYVKHALQYGGGLVPHAIGGILILMTNRFFLTKMIGVDESGMYGTANQVCSVISILTLSFNNAYVPWLFKKLSNNEAKDKYQIVKLTYLYFVVVTVVGLLFYLIQPLIFKYYVGSKFVSASQYCIWIILGFVFQGMYFMVTNYINYAEKTYLQALLTLSVGVLSIPMNYIFINYFGL